MKHVNIFTDGACSGNPGPGGFGAILRYGDKTLEISKGYRLTTNNRMEIMAVLEALRALKESCEINLYSDSKYVIDALCQGWAKKWRAGGWMRNKKDKALNPDLWEALLTEAAKHKIEYIWVKGHAGHIENERCDSLAVAACLGNSKIEDTGYKPE